MKLAPYLTTVNDLVDVRSQINTPLSNKRSLYNVKLYQMPLSNERPMPNRRPL